MVQCNKSASTIASDKDTFYEEKIVIIFIFIG